MRLRTDCVIKCDSYDEDMDYSNVASLGSTSPDLTKWFCLRTSGLNQGFDKEMGRHSQKHTGERLSRLTIDLLGLMKGSISA